MRTLLGRWRTPGKVLAIALSGRPSCATKFAVEGLSESPAQEVSSLRIKIAIIEPSGFRNDWAGRSASTPRDEIEDYAPTAGRLRRSLAEDSGTQKGDPARAAAILIRVAARAEPPLRLPLGADAHDTPANRLDELRMQSDAVKDWTPKADFPDGE